MNKVLEWTDKLPEPSKPTPAKTSEIRRYYDELADEVASQPGRWAKIEESPHKNRANNILTALTSRLISHGPVMVCVRNGNIWAKFEPWRKQ